MRIFPVTVKRTTIIQGGSGPNPTDALSVKFVFPDTTSAPTDAAVFAFAFPDTVAVQVDAVGIAVRSDDTVPVQADATALLRITGLGDSVSTASDNVRFAFGFPDTIAVQVETVTLGTQYADTATGQTDSVPLLRIAGLNDTVSTASETLSLAVKHTDANGTQTEALSLRITQTDSSATPTDGHALRLVIADTSLGETDNFTGALSYTTPDSNNAPAETVLLRSTFGVDSSNTPTDTRSGTMTWVAGATTAASSGAQGWTSPANAQGTTPDTAVSSWSDANALATAVGTLTLDPYPNSDTTFASWAITKVEIVEYGSYTAGVKTLGADGWVLEGRINAGAYSIIQTTRVSFSNLVTPVVFDITAARPGGGSWTWADIDGWNMRLTYDSQLTETSSGSLDAMVLRVTATKSAI